MTDQRPHATTNAQESLSDQQIRDINESWILALKNECVPVRVIERCHATVQDAIDNNMD
jgi:hypothetical protein